MDLEKRMAEISQQAEKLKMELNKVEEEWSTFNIQKKLEEQEQKEVQRRMTENSKRK